MPRYRLIHQALKLLLLLAVLLVAGCNPQRNSGKQDQAQAHTSSQATDFPDDYFTLAYLGNFRGFQRPCGCTGGQHGGLLRVGSAIEALTAAVEMPQWARDVIDPGPDWDGRVEIPKIEIPQALVFVELGNFADAGARQADARVITHLEVLAELGAACAVLGGEEAALDAQTAATVFSDAPLPLISCNLEATLDGIKLAPSVEIHPGWYLIGVTVPKADASAPPPIYAQDASPATAEDEGKAAWAVVSDPLAGVQAALDALPAGARAIVAAAQLPPALAEQLITLPVQAVIGFAPESEKAGNDSAPLLEAPVWRALELNVASFSVDNAPLSWPLSLGDGWPDDPKIADLLKQGNERRKQLARANPEQWRETSWTMSERFLPQEADEAAPPAELTYAGADSCTACHAAAHQAWHGSRHEHAYQSLLEHNEAQTLDCLECHTTGLLQPGGYDPDKSYDVLADSTARVGCESCHGPGQAHVELALAGKLPKINAAIAADERARKLRILRSDLAGCVRCHDEYNSPEFVADEYWAKIKH